MDKLLNDVSLAAAVVVWRLSETTSTREFVWPVIGGGVVLHRLLPPFDHGTGSLARRRHAHVADEPQQLILADEDEDDASAGTDADGTDADADADAD
eukprot:CAMPEP_0167828060 /NCGR_PEP_ID=MMETSP0112_2-20121227/11135_1 /TAXON_ID=91324 /ORGANISM="Lotharella globosa, Strain CCCM811" /LENGTH=96 /DNA_ID=CAMNT_0007731083 /DNA_START=124 /DNA_END=412 /DNA_ORIENTATION=+